jgi:hypothetical protein
MLELLFEILGEFLIQVFGELLIELGLHSMAEPFRKPPNPWIAAIGYALFGAIFGGLSLLVISHYIVSGSTGRIVNLIATPVLAGLCMSLLGHWRSKRGQTLIRIDRFSYGYLFALSFALIRFFFAD